QDFPPNASDSFGPQAVFLYELGEREERVAPVFSDLPPVLLAERQPPAAPSITSRRTSDFGDITTANAPPPQLDAWWKDPTCGSCAACDACPTQCWNVFLNYDSWRGISDGDWQNNGLHTGINFGTKLGEFSDWTGVGFQIGASVGVYDWSGADYHLKHS